MSQEKCDICNEFEGEGRSLKMHKIHCAKKHEKEKNTSNPLKQEVKPRERSTQDRSARVPFSSMSKKLPLPPDADEKRFQYRWMNDEWAKDPARLQKAGLAGYKPVEGMKKANVGTNDDGSPIKGVCMAIPREWYEEDKKAKHRELDKVDAAIQGGTLEKQANDNRYIPDGIKIHSNTNENG